MGVLLEKENASSAEADANAAQKRRPALKFEPMLVPQLRTAQAALQTRFADLAGAIRRLLAGIVAPRVVRRVAQGFPHRDIRWDYVGLVDPRSATIRLKVHQQLARLHPADLADIIEDLGRVERGAIVSSLDPETAVSIAVKPAFTAALTRSAVASFFHAVP